MKLTQKTILIPWTPAESGVLEIPFRKLIDIPLMGGELVRFALHREPENEEKVWNMTLVESGSSFVINADTQADAILYCTRRASRLSKETYDRITSEGIKNPDFAKCVHFNAPLLQLELEVSA